MAKKKEDDVIVDVEEAYSKTEKYIEENKNSLSIITAAIIIIVGGYFGYKYLYVAPQEDKAREDMWKAEQYFEQDSFRLALYGDGNYFGFLDVIDQYGVTKAANLANYYSGISFLRMGDMNSAIEFLTAFDPVDQVVGPVSAGATGDAYLELGNMEEALNYYMQAVELDENNFTAPFYLMKAGRLHEIMGDFAAASEVYNRIKKEYPESEEGRSIDKYLARAEGKMNG